MTVSDDTLLRARITIPDHVVLRRFPDDSIALNLSTGEYHGLNDTAATMLAEVSEGGTPADVARSVAERADVGVDMVTADLLELLRELDQRGLIEVHGAG